MNINFRFKKTIIAIAAVALLVSGFLVHALAGLSASSVVFDKPPVFVQKYAAEMDYSKSISPSIKPETEDEYVDGKKINESEIEKLTADFSKEKEIVLKVILEGGAFDVLLRLFTHPEKEQRVKVALAFADLNARLNHDETSDFGKKKDLFWEEVTEFYPDIQNAFFEALIASAKEGTNTYIPYTLAWWMPGQELKNTKMLAWAAEHHPDPWVRRFAVFFVVEHGQSEELANYLLQNRVHDPDYVVRKEVLDQRVRRFKEVFSKVDAA